MWCNIPPMQMEDKIYSDFCGIAREKKRPVGKSVGSGVLLCACTQRGLLSRSWAVDFRTVCYEWMVRHENS